VSEPALDEGFYLPDGDRFVSTAWTRGPWTADAQHGGPPAALACRAVEALPADGPVALARLTLEILRPVPIAPLMVEARVERPGRRVDLCTATIAVDDGPVARATAWRVRAPEGPTPVVELEAAPHPPPEQCAELREGLDPPWRPNYLEAMEWRAARGSFWEPGPAAAWMRMRVPLVAGEAPSPAQRVLAAADSGNGISMVLPIDRWLFINVDLNVFLLRPPDDEWVCLDAITRVGDIGIGLAESVLWDRRGRIGSGRQTLLVAPR